MKLCKMQFVLVFAALLVVALPPAAIAAVEAETVSTIQGVDQALDTAISGDGKFFYVLSKKGVVEIFPTGGGNKEEISIGGKADKIAVSQNGQTLFLTDSETGTTRLVSVSFVQSINIEGSPIKGPESAPIAFVIFSDFQ